MEEEQCKNCVHYRQHYTLSNQRATAVNCGHCTQSRMKTRKPDSKACIHFTEKAVCDLPNREEVIRYLNTEVLRYIFSLKLPPEIE